jgi:RNA polymerase sigma-70 factor (ECF subfamily)
MSDLGAEADPAAFQARDLPAAPPEAAEEDTRLMLALRAGQDSALNELMRRWRTPLIAFFLRSTGSGEEAADLAQETFTRVYLSRERYQPGGKFSTWLFTIAANLARNFARWRGRHPTVELDAQPAYQEKPGQDPVPSAELEARERAETVRRAIGTLPEEMREALILFMYHDLPYREIAKIQSTNEKTVENRLYRARLQLKERLRELLE